MAEFSYSVVCTECDILEHSSSMGGLFSNLSISLNISLGPLILQNDDAHEKRRLPWHTRIARLPLDSNRCRVGHVNARQSGRFIVVVDMSHPSLEQDIAKKFTAAASTVRMAARGCFLRGDGRNIHPFQAFLGSSC